MNDTIFERIQTIIAEQALLEPSDIKPESTMDDLGLDSLGLVEMVFAIEEEFGITVPFNANDPGSAEFDISSVQTVVDGVERLQAEVS